MHRRPKYVTGSFKSNQVASTHMQIEVWARRWCAGSTLMASGGSIIFGKTARPDDISIAYSLISPEFHTKTYILRRPPPRFRDE
jgi:hypothetical protein